MANVNRDAVARLIKDHWETPFTEALDRDITFFQFFPRKSLANESLQWKIHYPNTGEFLHDGSTVLSKGVSYAENAALTATNKQSYVEAESFVRQMYVGVEVTGLAQAATQGQAAFMQALANESKEAVEDLKDTISDMVMADTATGQVTTGPGPTAIANAGSGNAGLDIDGFRGIILRKKLAGAIDGATHYANLPYASNTYFKSYHEHNSSVARPLTLALLQKIMTEMEKPARMKAQINKVICARVHFYQYGNILSDYRRFTEAKMDGGFTSLDFEGTAITAVPVLPAGEMWFLDTRDWGYYTLTNFETIPQSVTHDGDRYVIIHRAQLICKNPGRNAVLRDLVTT